MNGDILAVGRSADSIAMEIKVIVRQAHRVVCSAAIEIGERLIEAKKLVPHGEWEEYVSVRCGFKPRTAQAYMQVAADREKAQTFAGLEFSKVLLLLAMPEGQAEALTAEHDPQSMTVRDLKRQIAEYKERLEKAADAGAAQQQLLLLATEENGALKQRLEGIDADYQAQLDTVDRENDQLRVELEAAKNRPAEISGEDADKLRAEGAAKAHAEHAEQEAALAENVRRLKMELQSTADAAGKSSAEKDERIRELERQLSAAAPGTNSDLMKNEVLTVLAEVQTALNKMHGCYLKSQAGAPKLADAIKAQAEKLIASLHSNFGIEYV
jgi:chromosome segregation ATPase